MLWYEYCGQTYHDIIPFNFSAFQDIMAKIESVIQRQRGAFEFDAYYNNLCALQNSVPLAQVTAHLKDGMIDVNGDRIR